MNYGEQICEAASIIAQGLIDNIVMDKTIKAVIEDNTKSSNGTYTCTFENIRLTAYGSPYTYAKGDLVYILIPDGKWENKKHIIGFAAKPNKAQDIVGVNVVYNKKDKSFYAYAPDGTKWSLGDGKSYQDYEKAKF